MTHQKWIVGILTSLGQFSPFSFAVFATKEAAERQADRWNHEKPFLHYVARPL